MQPDKQVVNVFVAHYYLGSLSFKSLLSSCDKTNSEERDRAAKYTMTLSS